VPGDGDLPNLAIVSLQRHKRVVDPERSEAFRAFHLQFPPRGVRERLNVRHQVAPSSSNGQEFDSLRVQLAKVLIGGELAVKHQVLRSGAAIPPVEIQKFQHHILFTVMADTRVAVANDSRVRGVSQSGLDAFDRLASLS